MPAKIGGEIARDPQGADQITGKHECQRDRQCPGIDREPGCDQPLRPDPGDGTDQKQQNDRPAAQHGRPPAQNAHEHAPAGRNPSGEGIAALGGMGYLGIMIACSETWP